jgi:putative transposase
VSKDYQKKTARTSTTATGRAATTVAGTGQPVPVLPDVVSVAMSEIAADVREGLLAIAVGAGLQVMAAMMVADVEALCGPKGWHDPDRAATRHGSEAGSVTLGGRRLPLHRPRVRATDGSGELPIASYQAFTGTEMLGRRAMEQMLAGLSTRRYAVGLEPVGEQIAAEAASVSKSAVSRRFVAATQTALADLMSADLSGLDLVAFMVDGVHFGEHVCVVALGITIDGTKVPLAIEEGSTENATLVRSLIVGLRERGLDVTRPVLAVLDGAKALHRAVLDVFDHPVIARCQLHKLRNVRDRLPQALRTVVERRMRAAYHADSALAAHAELEALATELDKTHPGRRGQPARRPARDPHRAAARRAAHAGPQPAQHQPDRIHDRDLPGARQEREELEGRSDGPALGRRRHARSRQAIPPGQRPPAPTRPARRSRSRHPQQCRSHRAG